MHRAHVELAYPASHLLPGNLVDLAFSLLLQVVEQAVVVADAIDGVGKGVDVPVVHLDTVVQDLSATALLRYDGGRATLHGLERRDAKRLRH